MVSKKLLPINNKPTVQSYTYHSYLHAILESDEYMGCEAINLSINDGDKYKWITKSNDAKICWRKENQVVITADTYANNMECFIMRECTSDDEIVIKVLNQKSSIINLILTTDNIEECIHTNKEIYRFGTYSSTDYYVKINEEDYSINKSIASMDYPVYLRITRRKQNIIAYTSINGKEWEKISEEDLPCSFTSKYLYIGINTNTGEGQYYNWFFMNYIQTWFKSNDPEKRLISIDYYISPQKSHSFHYLHQFLNFHREEGEICRTIFGNIDNYIKWNLDNNRYVEILLDEYYIPERAAYQNRHYLHASLIYGYDDSTSCYHLIGYKDRIVESKLFYSEFTNAYNKDTYNSSIKSIWYSPNSNTFRFALNTIYRMINDYVKGKNTSVYTCNIVPLQDGVYGIKAYDELLRTEKGTLILFHDVRVSYFVYEHNRIMKQRLVYMEKKQIMVSEKYSLLIGEFNEIMSLSEKLKNYGIKNYMKRCVETEERMVELLTKIEQSETLFYKELLEVIRNELNKEFNEDFLY